MRDNPTVRGIGAAEKVRSGVAHIRLIQAYGKRLLSRGYLSVSARLSFGHLRSLLPDGTPTKQNQFRARDGRLTCVPEYDTVPGLLHCRRRVMYSQITDTCGLSKTSL